MRKCISYILTLILSISILIPGTVLAAGITILSPESDVEASDTVLFEAQYNSEIRKMYFILDGDRIADFDYDEDGIYSYNYNSEELYIGVHTFETVVVADNGGVVSQSHIFNYIKNANTLYVNDPDASGLGSYGFEFINNTGLDELVNADGKDAAPGSGGAFAIKCNSKTNGNDPFIQRVFSNPSLTGIIKLSFDVKFSVSDKIRFYIECKDSNGQYIFFEDGLFYQGRINYADAIEANKWYKVEFVMNFDTLQSVAYIDENYSNPITHSLYWDSSSAAAGSRNLYLFRMCADIPQTSTADKLEAVVDNFKMTEVRSLPRIVSVTADDGGSITSQTDTLKLSFTSEYTSELLASDINILSDNASFAPTSVIMSEDKLSATVTIPALLSKGTDYKITINDAPEYTEGTKTYDLAHTFTTSVGDFGASNVGYRKGFNRVLFKDQVSSGDMISAEAEITNNTSDPKTVTIILAFYDGNEMIGLTAKSATIPSGVSAYPIATQVAEFPEGADIVPEVSLITGWQTPANIYGPVVLK